MNRELSPLEAFKKIATGSCNGKYREYCNIVETELKECQHLKETRYVIMGGRCSGKNHKVDILLKLKALEIIEKKGINIKLFKETDNFTEYNELIKSHYGMKALTQKEYNLLKEVLL